MKTPKDKAQHTTDAIIANCEAEMPKCYNEEFYKIHLGNAICDAHIALLKERKAAERAAKKQGRAA